MISSQPVTDNLVGDINPVICSADEASPLLASKGEFSKQKSPAAIICLLLVGVFIANVDNSLVIATMSTISSSFNALHLGSWLTTAYTLSVCATQPLIGKLSDVFGRKAVLLNCYTIFCAGTLVCGLGQSIAQVIAGRAIAGLGGAGMTVVVSVIITDLVPPRDVAVWRSYVAVLAATGRMTGAPLGGLMADVVGWRFSFLLQVPVIMVAIFLVYFKLGDTGHKRSCTFDDESDLFSKVSSIDFLGSALLSSGIILFILAVDAAGKNASLSNPFVIVTAIVAILLLLLFIYYESYHAVDPIFPPRLLLQRDVATAYAINLLQCSTQLSLNFTIPLYFRVVSGVSNTVAGSKLLPTFVANTVGSVLAGYYIKRTGYYKVISVSSMLIACSAFVMVNLSWHGDVGFWKSLEIIPAGFGSGLSMSAAFIAMTANMPSEMMATATGGLFLASNIGVVLGVSTSSSIQRGALRYLLGQRLDENISEEIIENVLDDALYTRSLTGELRRIVMATFIESLEWSHVFSLVCSFSCFLVALCIKEHRLKA